jgi:hypothetical protein
MKDGVPHPYQTTGKILIPYIFVFTFTDRRLENKYSELNSYQIDGELNCFCHEVGKVKVKLPLPLTKHHVMKTYWESGGIAPRILNWALDGGE